MLMALEQLQHMHKHTSHSFLQEGVGTAIISAYVEIIFDNADNRFPVSWDRQR